MSIKLNELSDNIGSGKNKKRVGRGIGSGKGKTSGHGHKGQKARKGVAIKGFEGGQMPVYRRLPKRGFTPHSGRVHFTELTLAKLNALFESGKIKKEEQISIDLLKEKKIAKNASAGISLIATGTLRYPVTIELNRASSAAVEQVEKLGGTVKLVS